MGFQRPMFSEEEPTPAVNPSGLLGGFVQPDFVSSLHFLMEPEEIAAIENSEGDDALRAARTPAVRQMAARAYDGVCRMPDGTLHPYIDRGGGYGDVYGAVSPNSSGQFGIGEAANGTTAPISSKRGGISGGGKSGKATSPASLAARGLTGGAKFNPPQSITSTRSVGGAIGRSIPYLGAPLMWLDVLAHQRAPVCIPEQDPTAIY